MIYRAIKKDLGTGSITGDSQQSYVVPYYVYTDNLEAPASIYETARSESGILLSNLITSNTGKTSLVLSKDKLPVFGTVASNLYVSNINIERVSENNLRSIPGYGLAPLISGSYTCWLYTVTFSASTTTVSMGGKAPWESDTAISCTWSPKSYERYDNKTLKPNFTASKKNTNSVLNSETVDDTPVPNYPLGEEKYQDLENTVGDDLYRARTIYNYVLNFSYAVRRFDAEFLPLYLGSMNLNDCVIAGIPVKKYHAVINDMKVTQAEWNGKLYYTVEVEVEIQYQQRLTYDEYMASGHRAYMLEGKKDKIHDYLTNTLNLKAPTGKTVEEIAGFVYKYTASDTIKKYPVPIEKLEDVRQRSRVPDYRWFLKKKNLGYFNNLPVMEQSTKTVALPKKIYIQNDTLLGNGNIVVSYKSDLSNSFTLYIVKKNADDDNGIQTDDGYIYSVVAGTYSTQNEQNLRFIKQGSIFMKVGDGGYYETLYYSTRYVQRPVMVSKEKDDVLKGEYVSIEEPVALNKYGGIYFNFNTDDGTDNTTSLSDDVTQPSKVNMYDPMLGKVKDYQHVARDWSALAFPKKGMFHSTADNNFETMNSVSTYFNGMKRV